MVLRFSVSKSKDIGTRAESAVVKALHRLGFPNAERRALAGVLDKGDILVNPGSNMPVIVEVKGGDAAKYASDGQILRWMDETDTEVDNAEAHFGFLVVQRPGIGYPNAHRWWAVTSLGALDPDADDGQSPVRMTLEDMTRWVDGWLLG